MTENKDILNFLRLLSAESYLSLLMTASREKYGKYYFSLEAEQRKTLDTEVWQAVAGFHKHMTPQWLGKSAEKPIKHFGICDISQKSKGK